MMNEEELHYALAEHNIADVIPLYFPSNDFEMNENITSLTNNLINSLSVPPGNELPSQVKFENGFSVACLDFKNFLKFCNLGLFYSTLAESPRIALSCLCAAVHAAISAQCEESLLEHGGKINVRIHNHPESNVALKNLKAAFIDKLVTVRGTVVKVSTVKPLVTEMTFDCEKCKCKIIRFFTDGKFSPPTSCNLHGCKSKKFAPLRTSARVIDFQKIRLQELRSSDEEYEEGRVPRTVECELTEDLIDACIPGDVVTVTGIVRTMNNYVDIGGGKGKNKNQGLFYLYIEVNSIVNSKSQSTRLSLLPEFSFSDSDLEQIVKLREEYGAGLFRQITQSICPSIYGHELVKAGITLALFGGVRMHSTDPNKVPVRGDIHVIIVGDPGLGKSQLLQAATAISPRGIYVCGNATTNAGLTVAVVKDSTTGDYAFEAGAMVLADSGLCCIDEFDKMSAEHQALLEAMEQQCVSVAKAGLLANLSARTSVLAAANPAGGHYNRAKTVNENLKMNAALLSRFDLIFILLDKPDQALDKKVSDHIMLQHARSSVSSQANKRARSDNQRVADASSDSILQRLRFDVQNDTHFFPIPSSVLRKYVAYARSHVNPRMSKQAADIIQKFYLQLRDRRTSADGSPITARQLESLVRLAQARARLELRTEITAQDATDVVEIMKESLYDKYVNEHGNVDFARSGGMSQRKEAKRFLSSLNKQTELQRKDIFSIAELYTIADDMQLRVPDLDSFIENLNSAGYLIKKGPKRFQVLSSSY